MNLHELSESTLTEVLRKHAERAACDVLVGDLLPDHNFGGRILIVTNQDTYYSIEQSDIVDTEPASGKSTRAWIRRGAVIWRATRTRDNGEPGPVSLSIEVHAAPPLPSVRTGAPGEGMPGATGMMGNRIDLEDR